MMLNPTWMDVDFPGYLTAILFILLAGYIVSGIRLAVFVYIDAGRRNIPKRLKWFVLTLLLNGFGVKLYSMLTKRPETSLSFSTSGIVFGDKAGKWNKYLSSSYGYYYLILTVILIFVLLNIVWRGQLISFLANQSKGGGGDFLLGLFLVIIFAIYFFLGKRNPGKINPLDKPVFGAVKVTDQGVVDESWSKHKKWVIILSIIVIPMILFFAYIFISAFYGALHS